ncbi:integrase catalytic domain-containing protein [Trichonephila clavipes]|nr:integrase catalytic domain-containing protein [Trichonephila clavipes]
MHNVLLCETKLASPKEKIVSTLWEAKRNNKNGSIKKINILDLVIPQGIVLNDEGFNQPSEISCLIGSEHVFDIFGKKQIRLSNSWRTLDKTLRSFWETENISEEQLIISDELSYCEKHFEKTHFRKPCGRYSVALPFKENVNLGDSRSQLLLNPLISYGDA